MKTFLVIGLGRFGLFLSKKLCELGNEVMVVDENEQCINDIAPFVSTAQIGDCTQQAVLETLGVKNFDTCFVCMGEDFQSSLEITSLLKEMGAKHVVSKANRDIQAKFLLRNGADEVIYAEKSMAEKTALKFNAENIFDYIQLDQKYCICETPTPESWCGRTIAETNCRAKYKINILAIKAENGEITMPMADHVFVNNEHLMIMGEQKDVNKLLKRI